MHLRFNYFPKMNFTRYSQTVTANINRIFSTIWYDSWLHFTVRLVFLVFTSWCLVAASNGWHSPSPGFTNCPRPRLQQLSTDFTPQTPYSQTAISHKPLLSALITLFTTNTSERPAQETSLLFFNPLVTVEILSKSSSMCAYSAVVT
jgi:hypothetical protein